MIFRIRLPRLEDLLESDDRRIEDIARRKDVMNSADGCTCWCFFVEMNTTFGMVWMERN